MKRKGRAKTQSTMEPQKFADGVGTRTRSRRSRSSIILFGCAILASTLHVLIFGPLMIMNESSVPVAEEFNILSSIETPEHDINSSHREKRQRICFLAGPHKTGSTSIQTNLWRWSIPVSTYNFTNPNFSPIHLDIQKHRPIVNWIWPAPPFVVNKMKSKATWNPGKAFYPLLIALTGNQPRKVPLLDKSFPSTEVIDAYRREIKKYWDEGHDIVFGTEAMDRVTVRGPDLIKFFSKEILPDNIIGSQMTVVVTYRSQKIDQLISAWRQQMFDVYNDKSGPSFYKWIIGLDEYTTFKQLNALGMVDAFLNYTDWNVGLIDLQGLNEEGWDASSFVACEILGETCENKTPIELTRMRSEGISDDIEPKIMNVRKHDGHVPNMSQEALNELDDVLTGADCHYLHKFLEKTEDESLPHVKGAAFERLGLYHPSGMEALLTRCKSLPKKYKTNSKEGMIKNLLAVALKHGSTTSAT